jgi:hypothetical protein
MRGKIEELNRQDAKIAKEREGERRRRKNKEKT